MCFFTNNILSTIKYNNVHNIYKKGITMKASIIIALDSNVNFTRNFLYFLSKYKTIEDYEIIITSDGNNDINYEKLVYEFLKNKCIYIKNKCKQGYGVVNNIAARHTSTDILIFMNSDVILDDNCLEALIEPLSIDNIEAVQPLLIYPQNMTTQSTGHSFCQYYNTHLFENRPIRDSIVQQPDYRKAFTTALCSIKKKTFNLHGGFNEKYFNAWEGMELGLKITLNGGKCYYNPLAKAFHIRGGGRSQYKIDEKNQSAFFWSHWGNLITENLSDILNKQLKELICVNSSDYILINFSCIRDFEYIQNKLLINISDAVQYTELAGYSSIEFFKTLPYFWLSVKNNLIYLANNFSVITNNRLWFEMRKNNKDLIIDLSGNCLLCQS